MRHYSLKEKLQAGETVFGSFVSMPEPSMVEAIGLAGYDFVLIDMEHTAIDFKALLRMLMAADAASTTPIVRVGTVDPNPILRVLDSGAAGVVAAHVQSASQAESLVQACRYPPEGHRGVSGASRAAGYGAHLFREHAVQSNREVLTVALIEDVAGVEAIEEIAAVPGLDILLPGSGDLSASLGLLGQPDHPAVQAAVNRIVQAVRSHPHLRLGFHIMHPSEMERCRDLGATFIVYSQDSRILFQAYRDALSHMRN